VSSQFGGYRGLRNPGFCDAWAKKPEIHLDTAEIEANIEHTRFPVPDEEQHEPTDDFSGLVRAADLIGQLADINYLRKTAALFSEFREIGMSNKLKLNGLQALSCRQSRLVMRLSRQKPSGPSSWACRTHNDTLEEGQICVRRFD
jgi:hypothetical protein